MNRTDFTGNIFWHISITRKSLLVKNSKEKIDLSSKNKTKDHLTHEDIYNRYDLILINVSKPSIYHTG